MKTNDIHHNKRDGADRKSRAVYVKYIGFQIMAACSSSRDVSKEKNEKKN